MGVRKREKAIEIKEAKRSVAFAKLNNCPTSPRKMRLVADLVRGISVEKALAMLKFNQKEAATSLHKLLLSAIDLPFISAFLNKVIDGLFSCLIYSEL